MSPVTSAFPDGELHDAAEVGAVDSQSVRLWVRQPGARTVSARLEVEGEQPVTAQIPLSAETDWTGVITFTLPRPAPSRRFVCTLGEERRTGRLAPAPETHTGLTFGFGSCHRPFKVLGDRIALNEAAGIYRAIAEDLRGEDAAFMLYAGDQVYSDELAPISIRDKLPGDAEHPPPLDVAVASYRRVSRGFLGHAGLRALREAFPSYFIWDDHDIFNNWGSRREKSPMDLCLFEAAGRVYCEYQHQRNPGGAIASPPYHYTFRHGDIGFLVLDVRGARDLEHGQLLGLRQWQAIRDFLSGAEASTITTLFVVTTVPVVHVARWMARLFEILPGKYGDQARDRWCSTGFVASRDALLAALLRWQKKGARRQVFLLSGDVHAASAFTIRPRRSGGVIRQLTSSAFSTPHSRGQQLANRLAVRGTNLFERRFRFRRHLLVFPNNYGLVRILPLAAGGHRVSFSVRAWVPEQGRLRTAARLVSAPKSG